MVRVGLGLKLGSGRELGSGLEHEARADAVACVVDDAILPAAQAWIRVRVRVRVKVGVRDRLFCQGWD